jgi:hypothetical protein
MPKTVERSIAARHIRIGDEVLFPGRRFTELVDDVDPKRTYNHVSTDYGVTKVAMHENVTVYRSEPTEEEAEAQHIERANTWIREAMAQAARRVETYREELITNLTVRDISWHARSWENFAEAQVAAEIWESVVKVAVNRKCGLIEATRLWAAKLTEEILSEVKFGSRGSSLMHNVSKEIILQVQASWVDDLRWRL